MKILNDIGHIGDHVKHCIRNCAECHAICLATVPHCLLMGGEHAWKDHIMLLVDCAEICQTSANFMLAGSALHHQVCGVCAEACERCALDCERLAGGDRQMLACADMCRRCAESCREMAAVAHTM